MIPTILAIAFYTLSSTKACFGDEDDLTIEEWKSLKTEYFLQQLMKQLHREPKELIKGVTVAELPDIIRKIKVKNEEKRSGYSRDSNSCPLQDPSHPCCADSVEIDFHNIGWNFIISPRTIKYKFCRGLCNPEYVRPALFTKAAAQVLYVGIF